MKKYIFTVVMVVIFTLLPLSIACSPSPTPQTTTAEVKTLKIGCTLPFTNSLGIDTKKALEGIIIPAFNQAGGLTVKVNNTI